MPVPYTILIFIVLTRAVFEFRFGRRTSDPPLSRRNSPALPSVEMPATTSLDGTLAGLPRRILESEPLDRGALLRDTLLHCSGRRHD